MRRIAAVLVFVFPLICCFALPICAQDGSATLTGFIQDSSKAVIPGAKVTAIDTNTNQRFDATTGKDGSYTIVSLPVGPYQIQIEKPGFKTILKDDLFLHTQDSLQINFEMAIGSTAETVTVNGSATNESPAVSMIVTRDFVENMPLNGESFQDLIALAPGAISSSNATSGSSGSPGYYSIDGQRADANNFMVDGVSANGGVNPAGNFGPYAGSQVAGGGYPSQTALGTTQALLSVDALQEFRIQTSGYTAEYGRQPGGQIEITSRSGTDSYHGTAVERLRNTVMDANNWFANYNDVPRGAEHQNDFGGTLGGPLIIPHIYAGKKRSFFFFSYEGLRLLLPQFIADANMPTVAFRQSAAPGVQPYLNAMPLPNGAANPDGITAKFSAGFDNTNNLDATSIRFDQAFGAKLRIFFRYANTPSSTESQYPPSYDISRHQIINTSSWTLGSTWTVTSHLVDEMRFNFTGANGSTVDVANGFHGAQQLSLGLIVPAPYAELPGGYESLFAISAPATSLNIQDYRYNYTSKQHQDEVINSLSWEHAKHTIKFGADFRHLTPTITSGSYQDYIYITSLQEIAQGVANFIEPVFTSPGSVTFDSLSLYGQDHWRISPRLTIDFGLRWELNPPPGAENGLYPPALTSSNLSTTQVAPNGTPLYHTVYHNFAPRLGISWRVLSSQGHPVVLRAGSGIFYDTGQMLGSAAYGDDPFYALAFNSNVPLPASAAAFDPGSIPPIMPPYQYFSGLSDPHLTLPYTQQWNLSVDVGLTSKNTMTVSYVGNEGKHLLFAAYYNNGFPNNPLFTGDDVVATNAASSSYNALQIQDQGHLSRGLQVISSYTWAHAIDNSSADGNTTESAPERGNSDNDVRQAINLALTYEIPGVAVNRFIGALTHGWLLADRFTAEGGYPLQIIQGQYSLGANQTFNINPDLVPGVTVYQHSVPGAPGGWELNRAAFASVPLNPDGDPTRNGTLGRNIVFGPSFWTLNTALQRSFPLRDQFGLDFRIDAFNIFNHPAFAGVDTSLTDSTFGQATSQATIGVDNPLYASGAPRSLQASLKLRF